MARCGAPGLGSDLDRHRLRRPSHAGGARAGRSEQRAEDRAEDFVRTYSPKASEITREWHVVDAHGAVLGRLATEVSRLLRGKHKPTWAPHLDVGDHVVVVNADKLAVDPRKADAKQYFRHSGYPGGIRSSSLAEMMNRHPERVVELAVKGMLPRGRLGRQMLRKLRVYAGPSHPHAAQQPTAYELSERAYARRSGA